MKKLLTVFVAYFICLSCNEQSKYLSNEEVFRLNHKTYHSLHQTIRDSLQSGIKEVNDYYKFYSPTEKEILDSLISEFQNIAGLQVALLTFDSSMMTGYTVEEITAAIAIQHKNAITIGIAPVQRTMSIWNDSLVNNTVLNTLETSTIIDSSFTPYFAKGKYFEGTIKGLKDLFGIIQRSSSYNKIRKKNNGEHNFML